MARYKMIDLSPRFWAVELGKQILPGRFTDAVHHLLDHNFDLSEFHTRYRNAKAGASAYAVRGYSDNYKGTNQPHRARSSSAEQKRFFSYFAGYSANKNGTVHPRHFRNRNVFVSRGCPLRKPRHERSQETYSIQQPDEAKIGFVSKMQF